MTTGAVATVYDYSMQSYQGTDIAAFVLLISALHCLVLRVRDSERGMGWFALSLGALALWVAFNERNLPTGPELNPSNWCYLMCLATAAMGPGMVGYLPLPPRGRPWALGLIVAPPIAFAAIVAYVDATGALVARAPVHALTALSFAAMAATAYWASRREPSAGQGWLAGALACVPVLVAGLVFTGRDPVVLRYWAVLPIMVVGLSLPSVALLRRRRILEQEVVRRVAAQRQLGELNRQLEDKVAHRTADLQAMVGALQSFNQSVSHDLRGPLGGITTLARMADEALAQGDAALARRSLPVIADQAEASFRLVVALLELARVGDAPLNVQRVDTAQIARESIEQARLTAQGRLPQFVLKPLPQVNADPDLLRASCLT